MMASRSRQKSAAKKGKPNQLAELGLFDIPDLNAMGNSDDEGSEVDESTLESELEALLSGKAPVKPARPKPKVAPAVDIESLAADCMKEIDDDDDDDENLSNDEDLLNELQTLTTDDSENAEPESIPERKQSIESSSAEVSSGSVIPILEERLNMYNEALKAAVLINETSKIRRYKRAVKTIEGLLKSAKSGASVNEEDIPPVVKIPSTHTSSASSIPSKPLLDPPSAEAAPSINKTTVTSTAHGSLSIEAESTLSQLTLRRDQYKMAALQAKKDGDKDTALNYLRTVKTFNAVIEAVNNNQPVDLSNIPPPPTGFPDLATITPRNTTQNVVHDEVQTSSTIEQAALAAASEPQQEPEIFDAPPPPSTILEALEQRLEKYTATKKAAEAEGNSGKSRRLQRIIKQYETAIKDHKSGKAVEFEALPTPPGFAPIPVPGKQTVSKPVDSERTINNNQTSSSSKEKVAENAATNIPSGKKAKIQRTNTSTVGEKQLEFLLERQKLFKQAALIAKKNDDIPLAKHYLGMAKGFDSMIQATQCGLPIDTATIPTPPQLESDFVIVDVSECVPNADQSQEELFEMLEKDLSHQIEVCIKNKDHFLRLGDVSSASKFEKLGLESKKDLSVIQHLKKKGDCVPTFHYETRLFSMVQCHTDLSDNDLEVRVERGINLPGKPDDLDSYVRLEFPIPSDAPQRAKTHTVRDTNNPIFQEEFKFEFNRKSRSQLRQFKRQALKLDVWSKGGFLRSDTLLGTVHIKLMELESKCSVHDSFNLMDGRKACGGKLEVKLRIRDPLYATQVEKVREKWLVIGS